jgi:hypothetical protein
VTDETHVIEAEKRFRLRSNADSEQERQRALNDGASALEKLRVCPKLPLDDRETIARRIGFRIRNDGVDRSLLAKRAELEPKEIYRLALRPGEECKSTYRLRAAGKDYAAVIETLARLFLRTNVSDLADRITRGTSVHPAGDARVSGLDGQIDLLYSLADGIDDELGLTRKFKAIARLKRDGSAADPWTYWPACPPVDPSNAAVSEDASLENLKTAYWAPEDITGAGAATWNAGPDPDVDVSLPAGDRIGLEGSASYFWFESEHWEQVVGYLPHFFLGHQQDFCVDADFWPPPAASTPEGGFRNDDRWMARLAEDMFEVVGRTDRIQTAWDQNGKDLLLNGEPADAYRQRMYRFQARNAIANWPSYAEFELDDPDLAPWDPPAFFWLCLYPNADASALVPVLLSTGWLRGADHAIELVDERLLSRLLHYPVLGGETLGMRLHRGLFSTGTAPEPPLMAEWRRTAGFVEQHPLWQRHLGYESAASQIRQYRDRNLKGAAAPRQKREEN